MNAHLDSKAVERFHADLERTAEVIKATIARAKSAALSSKETEHE